MKLTYLCMAVMLGVFIPIQAGVNSDLARRLDSSALATFVSFAIGTLFLSCIFVFLKINWFGWRYVSTFPLWNWSGGILGILIVFFTIILAPKLGATTLLALIISGQMFGSLIFDHYGWFGFPVQSISAGRIFGVFLLISGAFLIRKF